MEKSMKKSIKNKKKLSNLRLKLGIHLVLACISLALAVVVLLDERLLLLKDINIRTDLHDIILVVIIIISVYSIFMFVKNFYVLGLDIDKMIDFLQDSQMVDGNEGTLFVDVENKSPIETITKLLQKNSTSIILKKQAEINALQNQINPHFLYNTLETIRGQALCCGASDIVDTTKALADIFRYNISQAGMMIKLEDELENIDSYMQIQRIRFNNKVELKKDIDEDTKTIMIPKLLIQPLVENALIHGVEIKRSKGHVLVQAYRTLDKLVIVVEDDGLGMSEERLRIINKRLCKGSTLPDEIHSHSSIGLENINTRIQLVYGKDYGISIMSSENIGTKVILTLGILADYTQHEGLGTHNETM